MSDIKTVDDFGQLSDPLDIARREDVAKMRASLLACSMDPSTTIESLKNITVLRVLHQVARIIKYLDLMDRLEAKLYESIERRIDTLDEANPSTYMQLIALQRSLQDNMIESHKLLQPYLNVSEYGLDDLVVVAESASAEESVMSRESRDKLRSSAKQILDALESAEVNDDAGSSDS